ncbi:MAG: hypothetical protein U9Q29_06005 [Campylobacterota bacterium]|nr:hypothetical protein [Campylobacterota bacterium]
MNIDISNIAEENHNYAIHLATFRNVIVYNNNTFEIANFSKYNPFETVDFWRNISLSAEILLKATLLKHHIPFFRKRAHGEYGEKVTALTNSWLDATLKELEIDYVAQINTGTAITALKSAEKQLFDKLKIDSDDAKLISQMFYIIIQTRRNRNSHFFFPNQGHIDISEVEMLYLPLLNTLEMIYRL